VASAFFGLLYLQKDIALSWKPWFFVGDPKDNATALIPNALLVSGVISLLYAVYAMVGLPRTKPKKSVAHPLAFLEAFALLRFRGVFILTIAALLISMIHNVYFVRTGPWLEAIGFAKANIAAVMSVGQIVEIFILAVLGYCLRGIGYRWIITLGAIAYFLRFAVFAWATTSNMNLAYLGIALHGFCFAFFFAAAFMFIDRAAPKDSRHSAQTAFGIAILGIGPILSGFFNGWLDDVGSSPNILPDGTFRGIDIAGLDISYAWLAPVTNWWQGVLSSLGIEFSNSDVNYQAIWWTLAIVGAIASILVLILFTDDSNKSSRESSEEPPTH
jgi:MFS family permease